MKKYNVKFFDLALFGLTKRGADDFGSTGGVTKVTKLDDSDCDSDSEKNKMKILSSVEEKIITQADWNNLEITLERAQMMSEDGKIIIDEEH